MVTDAEAKSCVDPSNYRAGAHAIDTGVTEASIDAKVSDTQ